MIGTGVQVKTGGQAALMVAVLRRHPAVVQKLIRRGADVNRVDALDQTGLSYARQGETDEIVALLRSAGARK